MDNAKKLLGHEERVHFCTDPYDAAKGTSAIILVTEWRQFQQVDLEKIKATMKGKVLFDGRNQFQPKAMAEIGFEYFSVGRPTEQVAAFAVE